MKYLIGQDCPDFIAPTLMGDGSFNSSFRLSEFFAGTFGIIFFYPLDFNYISWTELLSVHKRLTDFANEGTKVLAISSDSHLAHQAWQASSPAHNGLGKVAFPMVADMTRHVARLFDVLVAEAMPEAATIIVDQEGNVIFQARHDTAVGRNIDRSIEAIKMFKTSTKAPTSPVEQIIEVERNAEKFRALGYEIVAQSIDTDLAHPQWKMLPRDGNGNIKLSFPLLDHQHEWPKHTGMTIAIREGLKFHSTGLLMPDGQLLFEHHAARAIPRDFSEMLRIAQCVKQHLSTGETIPWELPNISGT